MFFEICASISTIAFVILVFYLVQTLKAVQHSLKTIDRSMVNLNTELDIIKININDSIKNSSEITKKINDKIDNLSPLLDSISQIGCMAKQTISSFEESKKMRSIEVEHSNTSWQEKIFDFVEFINLSVQVLKKIKKRS